ncbi:unnamed protein product [Prorocentrum cordatum]|uniref:Uncharacterized protein n=1 Tax=Prorocentrum cordatum TaxID=2364126 RepID=A0ABN9VPE8_9DINO|nr:unnamed protein product [Polarella glacialis]
MLRSPRPGRLKPHLLSRTQVLDLKGRLESLHLLRQDCRGVLEKAWGGIQLRKPVAAFRSLVYKLQWVGRETRAEAAGTASILATKVNGPSVKDLLDANKMILLLDVTRGNVVHERWRENLGPFVSLLKEDCTVLGEPVTGNVSVADAKGIYDTLSKLTSGTKSDRRAAIDLAVVRETMDRIGSAIRWVPHPHMPVDCLTKADLAKTNAAQLALLKPGMLRLRSEEDSLKDRRDAPQVKNRSRAESRRQLQ